MIDLADFRSILSLIHDEILLISVENRGGKAQVFVGEIKEAIERAIKAEAEVERLKLMVKSITGGLDECIETIHFLEAENAKLRKVLCIAQEVVNSNRGGLVPGYKFGKLEQALAELDEEGER